MKLKKFTFMLLAMVLSVGCLPFPAKAQVSVPIEGTISLPPGYAAMPVVVAEDFNIIPDDGIDDTENIQAAIDSFAGKAGILWLKRGVYNITQLIWRRGVEIRGVGTGASPNNTGTIFVQADGVNQSAIISDAIGNPLEYMHWSHLSAFRLQKAPGSTDTLGSGIEFFNRTGEMMEVHNIQVMGFPEDGIRIGEGGTPGAFHHINVTGNGRYGINLNKHAGSPARTQGITLDYISGDNNQVALINIQSIGTLSEMIMLKNIKAEASLAGLQQTVIRLENVYTTGVSIEGVHALAVNDGVGTDMAVVRVLGEFYGTIRLQAVGYSGFSSAITHGTVKVPIAELNEGLGVVYPVSANPWRVF